MQEYEIKLDRDELLMIGDCIMEVFKKGITCICHGQDDECYVYSKYMALTALEKKITNTLNES